MDNYSSLEEVVRSTCLKSEAKMKVMEGAYLSLKKESMMIHILLMFTVYKY